MLYQQVIKLNVYFEYTLNLVFTGLHKQKQDNQSTN